MEQISKDICLRCNGKMKSDGVRKIQLGQTGFFLGDIPNLIAGALEVEIYICTSCRKIEFYHASAENKSFADDGIIDTIAQKECPQCGMIHDLDYPKCPSCKYNYN